MREKESAFNFCPLLPPAIRAGLRDSRATPWVGAGRPAYEHCGAGRIGESNTALSCPPSGGGIYARRPPIVVPRPSPVRARAQRVCPRCVRGHPTAPAGRCRKSAGPLYALFPYRSRVDLPTRVTARPGRAQRSGSRATRQRSILTTRSLTLTPPPNTCDHEISPHPFSSDSLRFDHSPPRGAAAAELFCGAGRSCHRPNAPFGQ